MADDLSPDLSLDLLTQTLPLLQAGFAHLPAPLPPAAEPDRERMAAVMAQVAERMRDNYPYFHPLYAGQMLKPPHPVARAAYAMAMWLNPNNHALDGGRASSRMEQEAVEEIAAMFGWTQHLGHLTGGGTFANLEALWVAGQLTPGGRVAASEQAHYTHARISGVLGLPFSSVPADARGRMDANALEAMLRAGDVGTVVVTLGATATGAVDPLDQVLALRRRYGFRVHVDAAYGGYFRLIDTLTEAAQRAFACVAQADSIVIDPHKHGLQPYGCGCILFRDPAVGRFYQHHSPYTYFSSKELHLGEISLECSRAGAAAVALWATQRLLPLKPGQAFARDLSASRRAALELTRRLAADQRMVVPFAPELDIVVWAMRAPTVLESSQLAQQVFLHAAEVDLHLALAHLPVRFFRNAPWGETPGANETVVCLRSVLMKPEHERWLEEIWQRLERATEAAVKRFAADSVSAS